MLQNWDTTTLGDEDEVFRVLTELRGKRWLCRGQAGRYRSLIPSIDRDPRQNLSRQEKLLLERQGIDIFRSTARFFANQGEQIAVAADVTTLMVLRHYGVPTRLLDWSWSPQVAAYFATQHNDAEDGEIWCFDYDLYILKEGNSGSAGLRLLAIVAVMALCSMLI